MASWKQNPVIRFLSSYGLGLILLILMMVLTVLGTLYQAENGLYRATRLFYNSWLFVYPLPFHDRLGIPMPALLPERLKAIPKPPEDSQP